MFKRGERRDRFDAFWEDLWVDAQGLRGKSIKKGKLEIFRGRCDEKVQKIKKTLWPVTYPERSGK